MVIQGVLINVMTQNADDRCTMAADNFRNMAEQRLTCAMPRLVARSILGLCSITGSTISLICCLSLLIVPMAQLLHSWELPIICAHFQNPPALLLVTIGIVFLMLMIGMILLALSSAEFPLRASPSNLHKFGLAV